MNDVAIPESDGARHSRKLYFRTSAFRGRVVYDGELRITPDADTPKPPVEGDEPTDGEDDPGCAYAHP